MTHGGRQDIVSHGVGDTVADKNVYVGKSVRPERLSDVRGALTDLFIEHLGRPFRLDEFIVEARTNPTTIIHEPHIDIYRVTRKGKKGERIGVDIHLDESGEQSRVFFVVGPSWGERIKRSIRDMLLPKRNSIPTDRHDEY